MDKNFFSNFLRKDKKKLKGDLLALLATGVALIVLGNAFFSPPSNKTESRVTSITTEEKIEDNTCGQLEKRLEEVFSAVEGAGKVKVMVTLKTGNEIIVAEEEKIKESREELNKENTVVVLSNGSGAEEPLVLKEKYPEVEGVIIVAEGGGDLFVKEALSRGAQALLNVPAHKVEIFKMG